MIEFEDLASGMDAHRRIRTAVSIVGAVIVAIVVAALLAGARL